MASPVLRLCALDVDPTQLEVLARFVQGLDGIEIRTFDRAEAALRHLTESSIDVFLVGLPMPELSGREVLRRSIAVFPELPVIILTSTAEVETAVELLHLGARDYLTKPLSRPLFLQRVVRLGKRQQQPPVFVGELVGRSPALQAIRRRIRQLARVEDPVWVCGPTGAGLTRVARALHAGSTRRDGPFVTLDALPRSGPERDVLLFGRRIGAFAHESRRLPGVLDQAAGGTLVLCLEGGLDQGMYQGLRALGARGPRLVVTAEGFSGLPEWVPQDAERIDLPPLAQRRTDIALLAHHIVDRLNHRFLKRCFLTGDALASLQAQPWPGDVEELTSVLESAVLASEGAITPSLLLPNAASGLARGGPPEAYRTEKERVLRAFEEDYLNRLLLYEQGHLTRAATRAGMDRKNLWQLLRKHGIDAAAFKPGTATGSSPQNQQDGEHG